MKSTKQKAIEIAERKGIELIQAGSKFFTIELIAPDGKQFDAGLHCLVSEGENGGKSNPAIAWRNALKDLTNYNLKDCPKDCTCKEI